MKTTYDVKSAECHKGVALHHLIRKEGNLHAKTIIEYDNLFRKNLNTPEEISDDQIGKYQNLVKEACIDEIKKYEVILCTTAVSAGPRVTRGANVRQIILDEAGMCMEPETLIPLVSHTAEQIVLIGDHQQLRPIVKNEVTRKLGLEVSLFERYQEDAVPLREQYRMVCLNLFKTVELRKWYMYLLKCLLMNVLLIYHELGPQIYAVHYLIITIQLLLLNNLRSLNNLNYKLFLKFQHPKICEFPAKQFYPKVNLLSPLSSAWSKGNVLPIWPEKNLPIVFCHVEGAEKSLSVSTSDGNEQSKSNEAEKEHAVSLITLIQYELPRHGSILFVWQFCFRYCTIVSNGLIFF